MSSDINSSALVRNDEKLSRTIKNLKKAANRIKKAIKSKEKIIIYSDADLDGVSSAVILEESIKSLGGEIKAVYFPDREKEGYGINKKALNYLKKYSPALLISLDCGIGNFEEVKTAKKIGFEVIIIDHHEILNRVPPASIVVDPKQKGDKYPLKKLATAGIVFKLSQVLLGRKFGQSLRKSFLELTALATLADMMPEIDENEEFIERGLQSLENSFRPGLRVFREIDNIKDYGSWRQIAQRIISALNISEMKGHQNETYLLLTCSTIEEARKLVKGLIEKSYQRQIKIKKIVSEIEERILGKMSEPIIFEGGLDWPQALLGSVASRICRGYQKPVFLFKKAKAKSQGAVRMPLDLDGVKAMASCAELLEIYGGHPPAAGFSIKNENLEKFRECLIEYFS